MKLLFVSFSKRSIPASLLGLALMVCLWRTAEAPLCGYLALSILCCYLAIGVGGLIILLARHFSAHDLRSAA